MGVEEQAQAGLGSRLESRALKSVLPQPSSTPIANYFIPTSDIDELLDYPSILVELLNCEYRDDEAQAYAGRILQAAQKTFAILVCTKMAGEIRGLLDDGMTDADLPLTVDDTESSTVLISKHRLWLSTSRWTAPGRVAFLRKQWLMMSPVFAQIGEHFDLDDDCALPFTWGCSEEKDTGSSLIYIVRVHPSHWKFAMKVSE
jgi:hypothetical protein